MSEHLNSCKRCAKTKAVTDKAEEYYNNCLCKFLNMGEMNDVITFTATELCVLGALCGYKEFPGISVSPTGNEKEAVAKAFKTLEANGVMCIGIDATVTIDSEVFDCIETLCSFDSVVFMSMRTAHYGHILMSVFFKDDRCYVLAEITKKTYCLISVTGVNMGNIVKDFAKTVEFDEKLFKKLRRSVSGFDEDTAEELFKEHQITPQTKQLVKRLILKLNDFCVIKRYEKRNGAIKLISDCSLINDNGELFRFILTGGNGEVK